MGNSEILTDVRKIVRSINIESKRIQKDFGISIPQLLCLNYINEADDFVVTHRELTQVLHLNSSTVTGIINRLEKKGFLARLPKKNDKRVTHISLTSAGKKILEKSPDLLHEKLDKRLSLLPEGKIDQIKESLAILIGAFGIEELDAAPVITIEEPMSPK